MHIQTIDLSDETKFSEQLYNKMQFINPLIGELELYEFQYCLNNLRPSLGWVSVWLDEIPAIEAQVSSRTFYDGIQIKPKNGDLIILDPQIVQFTNMLFVGLVTGAYPAEWINRHFYFDLRGFYFLHRTHYFTDKVLAHLCNQPYRQFPQKQKQFDHFQSVGYRDFKAANQELDDFFISSIHQLVYKKGIPILIAIAGPTAAGKTEIVDRLKSSFGQRNQVTTSIEMDNFLTDRDAREEKGIHTQGKQALHFDLLKSSLEQICRGQFISIPRYNFIDGTSSHELDGQLKPGKTPIEIEPADIVFIEGNFPFLLHELVPLIGIKVVYLTDDPIRLKRKWKRDIDYRKKYEPSYFRNRFFKEQFIMSQIAYIPQMEVCDILVDTTGAAIWVTLEMSNLLS